MTVNLLQNPSVLANRFVPSQDPTFHPSNHLSLVQITDLHLLQNPNDNYNGINPADNLQHILTLIKTKFANMDAVILTGDLLQQPSFEGYSRLFAEIEQLGKPYIAMAGNHDVTLELDETLPFSQRRHIPVKTDERLVNCHKMTTPFWDIIGLDSSVSGKVYGLLNTQTLDWLHQTLLETKKPCIIFAHHPMTLVDSAWIDQHTLKNSDSFWEVVKPFSQKIKGIFVGHVHQDLQLIRHDISMFTCPAVSVQFKSFCDDYTLDNLSAGLRWINLYNNGRLATGIKRIDTM